MTIMYLLYFKVASSTV